MAIANFGQLYGSARAAANRLNRNNTAKKRYEATDSDQAIEGWHVWGLSSYSREKTSDRPNTSEFWGQKELVLGSDGIFYCYSWDKEEHYSPSEGTSNKSSSRIERARQHHLNTADQHRIGGLLQLIQSMGR